MAIRNMGFLVRQRLLRHQAEIRVRTQSIIQAARALKEARAAFTTHGHAFNPDVMANAGATASPEIRAEIRALLDQQCLPAIVRDGGDMPGHIGSDPALVPGAVDSVEQPLAEAANLPASVAQPLH